MLGRIWIEVRLVEYAVTQQVAQDFRMTVNTSRSRVLQVGRKVIKPEDDSEPESSNGEESGPPAKHTHHKVKRSKTTAH